MGSQGDFDQSVKNMTINEKTRHVEAQLKMLTKGEAKPIENSVYRSQNNPDLNGVTYADVRQSLEKLHNSR